MARCVRAYQEKDDKDAEHRIVIHMGARFLRIGRATDLYPTVVPCVVARNMRRLRESRPRYDRAGAPAIKTEGGEAVLLCQGRQGADDAVGLHRSLQ